MAQRSDGLDLQTLALTAVASATAAYVTSKIWAPGTLASAAMTPVIVAFIREGLRKPTAVMTSAVTVPGRARVRRRDTVPTDLDEHLELGAPPPLPPPAPGAVEGPVRVYSTRGRRLRWRLAVLTGLLGFAICVVAYTVPELIAGGAASGGGNRTTFFGGGGRSTTRTTTTTTTMTTTAPTVTTPARTVTTPAITETTPVQTPTTTTPTTATPPPAQTTPAPSQGQATTPAQTTP